MRKCRNWQTSKTKDLVVAILCGFKSHLPHYMIVRGIGQFFYGLRVDLRSGLIITAVAEAIFVAAELTTLIVILIMGRSRT